jgi:hypothetical protein
LGQEQFSDSEPGHFSRQDLFKQKVAPQQISTKLTQSRRDRKDSKSKIGDVKLKAPASLPGAFF